MITPKIFPFFLIILASIIFLSGCSTTAKLQPGERVEKKNRAAEYASFGSRYYDEAQYNQALDFFFLALKQNILVDNDKGIIESYNSIGKTYLAAGKIDSAEKYYNKAMEIAVVFDDPHLLIRCKNNAGEIFLARKEFASALSLFNEAYTSVKDPEKSEDAAVLLHNIGVAQKRLGNYSEAETSLLKALKINENKNKIKEAALDTYILASLFSKESLYPEALKYINKALDLDKLIENSFGIAQDLYAKGIIQQKTGALEEAYYTFKRDALIFESLALPTELLNCLEKLEALANELSYPDDLAVWQKTKKNLEKKNGANPEK